MSKIKQLFCRHKYADKNLDIVEINHYTDTVRMKNYCVKCGKTFDVKFSYTCMFGEVDAEIKKQLGERKMKLKSVEELICSKGFFYRMGVLCGDMLYGTYKFDSFDKMMQEVESIDHKYKDDMKYCIFCFQAFKDNSYDFRKSCFSQIKTPVNGVSRKCVAELILQDYEKLGGGE